MTYLTDKQLAARNQGYNANRAGESLLQFCNRARRELFGRLEKPAYGDTAAFETWITTKARIMGMDHNELREALKR